MRTCFVSLYVATLLALCVSLPAHAAATGGGQAEARALGPGETFERNLGSGEVHLYRLTLAAGRFARVVLEQRGLDLSVALEAPDGRRLFEVDSPNGSYGPEPLSFVGETPGTYRIEVRAADKKSAGTYALKVETLREPTADDRARVEAERLFREAYRLFSQPSAAGSRREAVRKYEAALPVFRSLKDPVMELLTLKMVGLAYHSLGELPKALGAYGQGLALSRTLGDRRAEATLLNNVGGVYDILGEPRQALEQYAQALTLLTALGNSDGQGDTLNNVGVIYYNLGELQKALEYYRRALPLRRASASRRREADTLDNLGLLYLSLGEPGQALDYLRQALELRRAAKDVQGEANTLHQIGHIYAQTGESRRALEYFGQALPLRRAAGDRRGEAVTLYSTGLVFASLGEPEKALEYHRQALELLRALGARREEALALNHLGNAQALGGHDEPAVETFRQSLALFRELGDRRGAARALQDMARVERARGHLAAAREQIEEAISLVEAMRAEVGSGQLRASFLASRQDAYEFYIDLLMQQHRLAPSAGHDAAALRVSERARARVLLEMLAESRVEIRRGVNPVLLERERNLAQLLNAKAERVTRLAGQRGADERVAALRTELVELENEYQQVQEELRRESPLYAAVTRPRPLGVQEIQQELLEPDVLLLEYRLGEERSYVWALTRGSVHSYELPPRGRIEQAAREVYELMTARGYGLRGESPTERRERIRRADARLPDAARELSRLVLGPVAAELGERRLAVVADGMLQYIPFAMLPEPEGAAKPSARRGARRAAYRPLLLRHEIISLPSASTWAVQREALAGRQPAPKNVAVIADPVFEKTDERVQSTAHNAAAQTQGASEESETTRLLLQHFPGKSAGSGELSVPRLPYTRQEAERILSVARRSPNLKAVDFDASRALVTSGRLREYRYVHFATHGYIDAERPGLSAVVLSLVNERGEPQEGFLRAQEVYNLELPAELVVLSACETGLGKEVRGEGLIGLTRGFMYAGARRVIVGLWSVSDRGTAELMWRLYRGLLLTGERPSAALRAAQTAMLNQEGWSAPYYWAAFVQHGEW